MTMAQIREPLRRGSTQNNKLGALARPKRKDITQMKLTCLPEEIISLLEKEYTRAVRKHGPTFATIDEGINAMFAEFGELLAARSKNDIDGKHGMRNETAHVVITGLKSLVSSLMR